MMTMIEGALLKRCYRHPSATARLMRWSCVNSKLRLASELSATGLEAEPASASPADPLAYSFFRLVSVDPLVATVTDHALQRAREGHAFGKRAHWKPSFHFPIPLSYIRAVLDRAVHDRARRCHGGPVLEKRPRKSFCSAAGGGDHGGGGGKGGCSEGHFLWGEARWYAGGVGLPWPLGNGGTRNSRLKQPPLVLRCPQAPLTTHKNGVFIPAANKKSGKSMRKSV